jgi:toxin ParE1/3/4
VAHRRVVFHPEAVREIEKARAWYEKQRPSAAVGFLNALDDAIKQMQTTPERWARYLAQTRRVLFHRYPYSLIYRVQEDLIQVLAVSHHRQREGYWVGRV